MKFSIVVLRATFLALFLPRWIDFSIIDLAFEAAIRQHHMINKENNNQINDRGNAIMGSMKHAPSNDTAMFNIPESSGSTSHFTISVKYGSCRCILDLFECLLTRHIYFRVGIGVGVLAEMIKHVNDGYD